MALKAQDLGYTTLGCAQSCDPFDPTWTVAYYSLLCP